MIHDFGAPTVPARLHVGILPRTSPDVVLNDHWQPA